tara:strand:+ start:3454 stop:4185 length:732 start_codon:yes stop_codon:yes gene_type:complete
MEANRKRTQVHMLPTEDITNIVVFNDDLYLNNGYIEEDDQYLLGDATSNSHQEPKSAFEFQHLYFTTDEEIKEGDWFINTNFQKIYQANSENSKSIIEFGPHPEIRKIIATTDPKLTSKDIIKIGNFVNSNKLDYNEQVVSTESMAKLYNKSDHYFKRLAQPSQAFIKAYCEQGGIDEVDVEYDFKTLISEDVYNEIVTFLKVDPIHNTITTHRIVEKIYNKQDLLELTMGNSNIIDWIEENL